MTQSVHCQQPLRSFCNKRHLEQQQQQHPADTNTEAVRFQALLPSAQPSIDEQFEEYEEYDYLEPGEYKEDEQKVDADQMLRLRLQSVLSLERGATGVYEPAEIVALLRNEGAQAVVMLRVPRELNYVQCLCVASASSLRQLRALADVVRKVHKFKRHAADKIPAIEGKSSNSEWLALDMGNIALHLFTPAVRERYDLEGLWVAGAAWDPLTQQSVPESNFGGGHASSAATAERSPRSEGGVDWDAVAAEAVQLRHSRHAQHLAERALMLERREENRKRKMAARRRKREEQESNTLEEDEEDWRR